MKFPKWSKLYVNGEWREGTSENVFVNTNPYNGEALSEIRLANKADIDAAYEAAQAAQPGWEALPAAVKSEMMHKAITIMERRTEEIVPVIVAESGGTILKGHIELKIAMGSMKEAATYPMRMHDEIRPSGVPGKENRLIRKPVGVVGTIAPWNFAVNLGMRSIAASLMTGNTVVLKPDSQTYISGGLFLAEVFEEAGIPKGVFNVVVADLKEVGDYFVEHPIPRMISFTGSTAAGRHIGSIAGKHLKKAALELGGNNAFIVLDGANIDQAVSAGVFGKFMHQGQICMCVNRFIVDRKVYAQFVEKFVAAAKTLQAGDPSDPKTVVGPLINSTQVEKVRTLIEKAKTEGATVALEGTIEGNVVSPFVITDCLNDMTIAQNEIFGPVAVVIPVDGEEEAIRVANDAPFGLSGAVFAATVEKGLEVASRIDTGMIHVHDQTINDEPHIAFGGEKGSGLGRFNGEWSLEEFTTVKWISLQHEARHYPFS